MGKWIKKEVYVLTGFYKEFDEEGNEIDIEPDELFADTYEKAIKLKEYAMGREGYEEVYINPNKEVREFWVSEESDQ